MIYKMASYVAATLAAKSFPCHVVYGPERLARTAPHSSLILIERAHGSVERVEAPVGQKTNPRKVFVRQLAGRAIVFAQASIPGARVNEHEADCDQLVDGLLCAIYEWAKSEGLTSINFTQAGIIDKSERADTETWPGVVYVLEFNVPRAVLDRRYETPASATSDYSGADRPEGTFTSVGLTATVAVDGEGEEPIPL